MASAVAPLAHEIVHCMVLAKDESPISVIVAVSPFALVDVTVLGAGVSSDALLQFFGIGLAVIYAVRLLNG